MPEPNRDFTQYETVTAPPDYDLVIMGNASRPAETNPHLYTGWYFYNTDGNGPRWFDGASLKYREPDVSPGSHYRDV